MSGEIRNEPPQPMLFGKYTLLERISHGGMAEVFRAKTKGAADFELVVAIKLLLPQVANDSEFVTMFIDEAKIAGQLSHANIAQIFDLGQIDGRYYIVQEYVPGRDLRAILRHLDDGGQRLGVALSCHIVLKVCEALDYAHNKNDASGQPLNLVHRDISPQNVIVSHEGEVKLIDFGIVKAEGRATRTLAGLVKGKFAYMSPEQIRGLPVDRRADVFAVGILMHELLTGKSLFTRGSEFETLQRARSAEIEPPSRLNPDVPPELDRIVIRALTRHVGDRYQTAAALSDDLWQFVRDSGNYRSREQLVAWMRETFGEPSRADIEAASSAAALTVPGRPAFSLLSSLEEENDPRTEVDAELPALLHAGRGDADAQAAGADNRRGDGTRPVKREPHLVTGSAPTLRQPRPAEAAPGHPARAALGPGRQTRPAVGSHAPLELDVTEPQQAAPVQKRGASAAESERVPAGARPPHREPSRQDDESTPTRSRVARIVEPQPRRPPSVRFEPQTPTPTAPPRMRAQERTREPLADADRADPDAPRLGMGRRSPVRPAHAEPAGPNILSRARSRLPLAPPAAGPSLPGQAVLSGQAVAESAVPPPGSQPGIAPVEMEPRPAFPAEPPPELHRSSGRYFIAAALVILAAAAAISIVLAVTGT